MKRRNDPIVTVTPTLGMFKLPVIEIDCTDCGRRGRYNRDRAIERHGADMTVNQFMRRIANCPRDGDAKWPCRIGCADLMYMFQGAPFTEKYSGE